MSFNKTFLTILQYRELQFSNLFSIIYKFKRLAVNDVINKFNDINNLKIFLDKFISLYHQSPKNQNELRQVANSLEKQILKINRIFLHFVAFSKRFIFKFCHK